jgi:hypothetical protein
MNGSVDLLIGSNVDEASLFLAFDLPEAEPGALADTLTRELERDLGPGASADAFLSVRPVEPVDAGPVRCLPRRRTPLRLRHARPP